MMFLFYFIFSRNSPPDAASGRALAALGRALAAYLARERVTSGRLLRVSEPRCPHLHPGVRTPHGQDSWLRADVRAGRPESQLVSQRKGLHPLPAPPVGRLPAPSRPSQGPQLSPHVSRGCPHPPPAPSVYWTTNTPDLRAFAQPVPESPSSSPWLVLWLPPLTSAELRGHLLGGWRGPSRPTCSEQ